MRVFTQQLFWNYATFIIKVSMFQKRTQAARIPPTGGSWYTVSLIILCSPWCVVGLADITWQQNYLYLQLWNLQQNSHRAMNQPFLLLERGSSAPIIVSGFWILWHSLKCVRTDVYLQTNKDSGCEMCFCANSNIQTANYKGYETRTQSVLLTHFCTDFGTSKIKTHHDSYQKFKVARTKSEGRNILSASMTSVRGGEMKCSRTSPLYHRTRKVASAIFSLWPLSICGS